MSLAKINVTKKSRKPWECSRCRSQIPVGSEVIAFTVGFRGRTQRRCMKPECFPQPSERESSAVSAVYAAQEAVDFSTATSLEELEQMVDDVAEACTEVASEYEDSEMFEINEDLQERAETLNAAAEDLGNWADDLDEEPTEDEERFQEQECESCEGTGEVEDSDEPEDKMDCPDCNGVGSIEAEDDFEQAHDEWLTAAREAAESAVNDVELP